jgi:hypothetical protein
MKPTVVVSGPDHQRFALRAFAVAIFYKVDRTSEAARHPEECRRQSELPLWTWFTENPRPAIALLEE